MRWFFLTIKINNLENTRWLSDRKKKQGKRKRTKQVSFN